MPPRIRSPTPSDEEEDQLMDSPPPSFAPPPPSRPTTIKIKPPLPPPPAPAPAPVASSSSGRARTKPKKFEYDDEEDEEFDELEQDELESEPDYQEEEYDDDGEGDYNPGGSSSRRKSSGSTRTSGRRASGAASTTTQKKSTRRSSTAAAASATQQEGNSGIKIKFKLGGGGGNESATMQKAPSTTGSVTSGKGKGKGKKETSKGKGKQSAKGKGKGKGKKKAGSDDDDSDEISLESDSDGAGLDYSDIEDDELLGRPAHQEGAEIDQLDEGGYSSHGSDGASSSAAGSSIYGGRKTARQRAKEMGGDEALELMSLPHRSYNKPAPPTLTAEEIALQKAEKSRKRKHQADKKLEDAKTETINRLLKKQVGKAPTPSASAAQAKKAGKSKLSKSITASGDGSDEEGGEQGAPVVEEPVQVFVKPSVARWVSSIREGEFKFSYSVPEGRELVKSGAAVLTGEKKIREPPRKRIFTQEEREEQRRLNQSGWERVMLGRA
ncbi:PAPA-1-like domain-containing protein [Sporobolomyces salmoneus]|uniref:PAPA-1-like domain-containing protein n=1 Tax=Sporobolomyces salmoneus TaxID=183962 RepID=UPI00316DD018